MLHISIYEYLVISPKTILILDNDWNMGEEISIQLLNIIFAIWHQ